MKKLKQFVIIQKIEKDDLFNCFCFPYIGTVIWDFPYRYRVTLNGHSHEFLNPEEITKKYGETHSIWYFDQINDLLKSGGIAHFHPYKN